MNKWLKITLIVLGVVLVVIIVGLAWVTRSIAHDTVYHPPEDRPAIEENPSDYGLQFENVTVTTEDGYQLKGWYVPGENGATVIAQHGSPGPMPDSLYEAALLNDQGYNVLLSSFRAHGESDGDMISFGYHETKDIAAWYDYLLSRDDVDPDRIGIFGESMGGGVAILSAAENEGLKAVATASAFALTSETIETFIAHEQPGVPTWAVPILANAIVFWAEQEWDFPAESVDTQPVVGQISPRPILIMHGGADDKVGPGDGQKLYDAAVEPKELWFVEEAGHVNFEEFVPKEYEQRLIAFFDKYLLDK
jgi:fermentation-respiration switch protein FrsA (DUF1100 family)